MKPAVIVCGCGRSGTNVTLEMLRGNPAFNASKPEEDKLAFSRFRDITEGYLSKCDTVYFDTVQALMKMENHPFLNLVWTMRDPRDMIMSKMRRGVPEKEGGDCKGYASDSTVSGAIEDIKRAVNMLSSVQVYCPEERVKLVKMEDILRDPAAVSKGFCEWLGLKYYKGMTYFWKRMRNKHKARRYRMLDKSQLEMWRRWKDYEGGWFVKKKIDLDMVFQDIAGLVDRFDYPRE